jgi:glycosyltransferase involved in cell wall biosynthesis
VNTQADTPDVSVIIPTLDAAAHLPRCLAALRTQRRVRYEVIVVDQGSSDETPHIAALNNALLISVPRPQFYSPPAPYRNLGARHARGRYLLHLDADMELLPGTLAACIDACTRHGYIAVVLHEVDVVSGFWGSCKALERRCYLGTKQVETARFVRSDVFWAVGGYDESLNSGEDWDIHAKYLKLGPVGDIPMPVLHHIGRLGFFRHLRKKYSYGRTAYRFLKKHGSTLVFEEMIRAYWHARRMLLRQPVHLTGFLLLRGSEIAALLLGMLVAGLTSSEDRRTSGGGIYC